MEDTEQFKRMYDYIKRCCERGVAISDVDVAKSLVLIMDEINAIKTNQKKEKPHQKGLEHKHLEQNKEEPKGLTRQEFDEQVRLLHAQRDF